VRPSEEFLSFSHRSWGSSCVAFYRAEQQGWHSRERRFSPKVTKPFLYPLFYRKYVLDFLDEGSHSPHGVLQIRVGLQAPGLWYHRSMLVNGVNLYWLDEAEIWIGGIEMPQGGYSIVGKTKNQRLLHRTDRNRGWCESWGDCAQSKIWTFLI